MEKAYLDRDPTLVAHRRARKGPHSLGVPLLKTAK